LTILTAVLALMWAIPLLWLIVASLRPAADPMGPGDVWFAFPLTLENFAKAFELAPFGRYFVNTIVIIAMVLGVQLVTVTLAAFSFANYDFWGKRFLFMFILLQLMIPTAILLAPNFATIRQLGLFDTRLAVAIPFFGSAFGTFLMRQAFLSVPRDLVDAGVIDGCNWWQLLRNVYLPPSTPMLVAFGLASVSFHWNAFLWPLIITNSDRARPLTAGLVRFTQLGEIGARWSLLAAATLIVAAPILIVFLVFQRKFIQSFMHSGIK
jgi:sn-glycerol 3-phosphate transport system permease protein